MNALPDDVARVLEDFCGAKEIVMLGRTSRRFRPNEKTWERHAKCNPLTEHVMVTWAWPSFARSLWELRPGDPDQSLQIHDYVSHPSFGTMLTPEPRFVLQIWSGGNLLTTRRMSFEKFSPTFPEEFNEHHGDGDWFRVSAGTTHLHVADGDVCEHCTQLRAGEAIPDSLGVELGLDCAPLRFRIVAVPYTSPAFWKPTVVFDAEGNTEIHSIWLQLCRGGELPPQPEDVPNDLLRGPEDSSPWGLDHHHEDLAFYPAGYYNPGFYSPLSTKPSCLVRITRDAGQNATGLIIDEFNWYFPRTEIGRLRVNTEFIRS